MELLRENSCIEFISEDQIEGKASSIAAVSQKACGYDEETIKSIVSAAPARMMKELKMLLDPSSGICVEELRFRVGRPLQLISSAGEILLPQLGRFTESDADRMLNAFCANSLYSKLNELNCGFLTLEGGARVGICGAPVIENGSIIRFTSINSFNIRIPRELKGCAKKSIRFMVKDGRPISCLIASAPGVGKTTFLRDCARCFSCGEAGIGAIKVAVADERAELSGGMAYGLDLGTRTDAMLGVPKLMSIPMLIRNMSPQLIITDELAGEAEAELVEEAVKCGVAVIASAHAGSIDDIIARKELNRLINKSVMKAFMLERLCGELVLYEAKKGEETRGRYG